MPGNFRHPVFREQFLGIAVARRQRAHFGTVERRHPCFVDHRDPGILSAAHAQPIRRKIVMDVKPVIVRQIVFPGKLDPFLRPLRRIRTMMHTDAVAVVHHAAAISLRGVFPHYAGEGPLSICLFLSFHRYTAYLRATLIAPQLPKLYFVVVPSSFLRSPENRKIRHFVERNLSVHLGHSLGLVDQ